MTTKVYQLVRQTKVGFGFNVCKMDDHTLFFKNKEDAKKVQNTFNGDKIYEVEVTKPSAYIYNIEYCYNSRSIGRGTDNCFSKINEAKNKMNNHTGKSLIEIYKHKIHNSVDSVIKSNYEPKLIAEQ